MATPFIGEMRIFAFQFAPRGWAFCNGQLLAINTNQALFSILGTTYGGNGTTNFALPNLQGRTPVHRSGTIVLGQVGGEASHTLIASELPQHIHPMNASSNAPSATAPTDAYLSTFTSDNTYTGTSGLNGVMNFTASAGGNQPHNNMQPYLVANVCIALVGVFPSRN